MKIKSETLYSAIIVFLIAFTLVIFGCAPSVKKPSKENVMERISSWSYPDFSDDMLYNGLEHSILKSLSYLQENTCRPRVCFRPGPL